jgi:dipeptide/tripeptide permease
MNLEQKLTIAAGAVLLFVGAIATAAGAPYSGITACMVGITALAISRAESWAGDE